eukprot:7302477-Prymnesium_polylepis.1
MVSANRRSYAGATLCSTRSERKRTSVPAHGSTERQQGPPALVASYMSSAPPCSARQSSLRYKMAVSLRGSPLPPSKCAPYSAP